MDENADAVTASLDFDLGDTGCIECLLEIFTKVVVLYQKVTEGTVFGIPAGIPTFYNADTQTVRIDFLAHYITSLTFIPSL